MTNTNAALSMWTVYDHPTDFPDSFVARRFEIRGDVCPTNEFFLAKTLPEVREAMRKRGLFCLPRDGGDDPKIVETWL